MHAVEEVLCRPLPRLADVEVTSYHEDRTMRSPHISTAGVDRPFKEMWAFLVAKDHHTWLIRCCISRINVQKLQRVVTFSGHSQTDRTDQHINSQVEYGDTNNQL